MNQLHLDGIKQWFERYVATFDDIEPEGFKNIRLKIEHTRKVCDVMELLAEGEGLSEQQTLIARTTALLHDVGRFPQYRRWRTFRDSDSDNHARLSIEVIREHRVLEGLTGVERMQVEEAVRFHNLLRMPVRLKSSSPLFLQLIRDADKLDIWRVFMEFFETAPEDRPSAVTLGFPELPGVSSECLSALAAGRVVTLDSVTRLNDFRLLLVSWAYDLNFSTSHRLLQQRRYIEALADTLPLDEETAEAIALAVATIERRAANGV
jgi:hypothetical protein